jgi:WD40 repeat protein
MQASLRKLVQCLVHGWKRASDYTPPALLALLCGTAFAPLISVGAGVTGAEAIAGIGVLSSVGGGVLSGVLASAVDKLCARGGGRQPEPADVEQEVIAELERALAAGDERSGHLSGEIAQVLNRIDAGEVALREAIETGNAAAFAELIAALGRINQAYAEQGVLLDDMARVFDEIRHGQAEQGRDIRELSAQFADFRQVFYELFVVDPGGVPSGATGPGLRAGWTRACPYPGLLSFDERQAPIFYGREKMTGELADRVAGQQAGNLVLVTGASGAGKTSLLRAGLLPMLQRGERVLGSDRWTRWVITPTKDPLGKLATVLATLAGRNWKEIRAELARSPGEANISVQQALDRYMLGREAGPGATRMVLIVDQFEETFTLGADEADVRAFVTALRAAATVPTERGGQPPALVVIAVRGDFLDRCFEYEELADAAEKDLFVVRPMTESEFRLAITGPASNAGLSIEQGLVDLILGDVHAARRDDAVGVLPLLSEAMRITWHNREGNTLTRHGYGRGGGVTRAIETSADRAYASLKTPGQRTLAQDILLSMTVVSDDGQLNSRPVSRAELTATHPADQLDAVRSTLVDGRLIVVDGDTVRLVHDALLTAWPMLREWLDKDKHNWSLHRRFEDDAARWHANEDDDAFLYRGRNLVFFQQAASEWPPDRYRLTVTQRDFLRASERAAARGTRLRHFVVGSLVFLLAVSATGAFIAAHAAGNADQQRSLAVSGQLAALSEDADGDAPTTAAMLAAAAWKEAPTSQARESMLEVLAQPGRAILTRGAPVKAVAFSSDDGGILATAGAAIQLWALATHRPIGSPVIAPGGANGVAFSPGGTILATADGDGTARLWDVSTRRQIGQPLRASGSNGVNAVAFSPDGRILATADGDGTVRLWDVATRRQIGPPLIDSGPALPGRQASDVAFSPGGTILATASLDGTARLWDVATHRQIGAAMTDGASTSILRKVLAVAFSPNGNALATADNDGTVRLWNVGTQRQIGSPITADEGANDVAFSPDGKILAVAENDGVARLWDVATRGQIEPPLAATTAGIMSQVGFSPDGNMLATVSADGATRLWSLTIYRNIEPAVDVGGVDGTAFSPDGKILATADDDGTARLWNLVTQRQVGPPVPAKSSGGVSAVAFSPDGKILATGDDDGTARMWDVATRREIGPPITVSTSRGVSAVAFSPDGKILATGDDDGTVRLWDVATRRQIGPPMSGAPAAVNVLVFNPRGALLATADESGIAQLWNLATRRPFGSHFLPTDVDGMAFSPDGDTLAAALDDGTARLWNIASGQQIGEPMAASAANNVAAVAFSPGGAFLATAGGDGTARLWDVATRRQVGPTMIAGGISGLDAVAFTPDGSTLATVGGDGTAALWNVAFPPDLLAAVCSIADGSLTPQQWSTYVQSAPYIRACP